MTTYWLPEGVLVKVRNDGANRSQTERLIREGVYGPADCAYGRTREDAVQKLIEAGASLG